MNLHEIFQTALVSAAVSGAVSAVLMLRLDVGSGNKDTLHMHPEWFLAGEQVPEPKV